MRSGNHQRFNLHVSGFIHDTACLRILFTHIRSCHNVPSEDNHVIPSPAITHVLTGEGCHGERLLVGPWWRLSETQPLHIQDLHHGQPEYPWFSAVVCQIQHVSAEDPREDPAQTGEELKFKQNIGVTWRCIRIHLGWIATLLPFNSVRFNNVPPANSSREREGRGSVEQANLSGWRDNDVLTWQGNTIPQQVWRQQNNKCTLMWNCS